MGSLCACADGNVNMADTLQRKMPGPANLREKLTSWDAKNDPKAPLGDTQKDSFMELTTHSGNRRIPVEVGVVEFSCHNHSPLHV